MSPAWMIELQWCCGHLGRWGLRCSTACSIPLRFLFGMLCLMTCGLVVFLGASCMAHLLFGALLPVLLEDAVVSVGAPALVGVSLFGCILITECTVAVVTICGSVVNYCVFLNWSRKEWLSKLALMQTAGKQATEQQQQQQPGHGLARREQLRLLAEQSFAVNSYQHAATVAVDVLIASLLGLCLCVSLLLSIWWPVDSGPENPTYPSGKPPRGDTPTLDLQTYLRSACWLMVLSANMATFFGLLLALELRSAYTLLRNGLKLWSQLDDAIAAASGGDGGGTRTRSNEHLARTCVTFIAMIILAPLLLMALPLSVLCLRAGSLLPGRVGRLSAAGLRGVVSLSALLPLPNLHAGGPLSSGNLSSEPQVLSGFAAVRLGLSVLRNNSSDSGSRTWVAFTRGLRELNVWYLWLWFVAAYYMSPAFAAYSNVILALSLVAALGVALMVNWRKRGAQMAQLWARLRRRPGSVAALDDDSDTKSLAGEDSDTESSASAATAAAPPPPSSSTSASSSSSPTSSGPSPLPFSSSLSTSSSTLHVADTLDSVDARCAWGSLMIGLCYIFSFIGFGVSLPIGLIMLLCTVFLSGHMCLKRSPPGFSSCTVKFLLVLLAAIFITFYSSEAYLMTTRTPSNFALSNSWLPGPVPLGNVTLGSPGLAPLPTAYDLCPLPINGASLLDHCFISDVIYEKYPSFVADVVSWFAAANRKVTALPRLDLGSSIYYATFVEAASTRADNVTRVYIVFKGTSTARDVAQNGLLFMGTSIFQFLCQIGPFGSFPVSAKQMLIGLVGRAASQLSLSAELQYTSDLARVYAQAAAVDPAAKISVTGHSLGGALATLSGQLSGIPSVSFSGPGILLSAIKLGLNPPRLRNYATFGVIPDYDIIPLVDEQVGTIQRIGCLNENRLTKCHSIDRTCCELRRQCGDPYGRTLQLCAFPHISQPQ